MSLGVGSCVGTGMYLVSGMVAKKVAGPAVVLSYAIAGVAAMLSGKEEQSLICTLLDIRISLEKGIYMRFAPRLWYCTYLRSYCTYTY